MYIVQKLCELKMPEIDFIKIEIYFFRMDLWRFILYLVPVEEEERLYYLLTRKLF